MDRPVSALLVCLLTAGSAIPAGAQTRTDPAGASDAAYAAMQERGREAMGVDQWTSTHVFDALPDGGRIELQRDVDDPAGVARIRHHLQDITKAFGTGDFSNPAYVHMQSVPGTAVLAERREAIRFTYRDLPRGGEVRIVTRDPKALEAIHEFLAFQRREHRAGGSGHWDHGDGHDGHDSGHGDHGEVHDAAGHHDD